MTSINLRKRTSKAMIASMTLVLLTACGNSWVQLTPEGERVTLATPSQVTNCGRVGVANVNAIDNIGFVQRSARQLQEELVSLARNEAGMMGGNRVVPESTINEGRQSFGVFHCL
jgi:hypothetical protein